MNFRQTLNEIQYKFENGDTPPEIIKVLNDHIDNLKSMDLCKALPTVGSSVAISEQEVFSEHGKHLLSSLIGERFLVLTWFRGNW
ncbi:MAG: hypothetical protein P8J33_08015 [Pirellulaceae bacterium]|nr:hypothetical protein [Pirellulaceae bacterium]